MISKPYTVPLELYSADTIVADIVYYRGDDRAYPLTVRLKSGGQTYVIPDGAEAYINFRSADGTVQKAAMTIEQAADGKLTYAMQGSETAVIGAVTASVELQMDDARLTWQPFRFTVKPSLDDNGAEAPEPYVEWTREITARMQKVEQIGGGTVQWSDIREKPVAVDGSGNIVYTDDNDEPYALLLMQAQTETLMEQTTVTTQTNTGGFGTFSGANMLSDFVFTAGEPYVLALDGQIYVYTAQAAGDGLAYIGDGSEYDASLPQTGDSFFVAGSGEQVTVGCAEQGEHTLSIARYTGEYFIPEGMIPAAIMRTADAVGQAVAGQAFDGVTAGSGAERFNDYAGNMATGKYAHAEGYQTTASGSYSHAEGNQAVASGSYSHAEGSKTTASASYTHAEGYQTTAKGAYSHAEGCRTIASKNYQHVQGKNNLEDTAGIYAHIVGNGSSDSNRANAHTLDWNGNAWFAGTVEGTALILSSATEGSTKRFRITVDDSGTLTAAEITA